MIDRMNPRPFDPVAALPPHTTVLEAGAGTGKTYTIAALTAQALARGQVTIECVMLVTFARAASYELRSRVHERLRNTATAIDATLAGIPPTDPDAVDADLCAGEADVLTARLARLRAALADFDRATIATTHEFCARLLDQLGILVDHDRFSSFLDDPDQLRAQVIDDGYLAWMSSGRPPLPLPGAQLIGEMSLSHPDLPLLDAPAGASPDAVSRVEFATNLRREFEARKRSSSVYGYHDMVQRVLMALTDPVTGELAARVLAARYDLVMVDEFQDTSPAQWQILEHAFHGRTRLVVIGDPRQAIYGFRGADLYAYLAATRRADDYFTLNRNYRSDAGVVQGITALFGQANLGTEAARVALGDMHAQHVEPRLAGASPKQAAVQIRAVEPQSMLTAPAGRKAIMADLVAEFDRLLNRAEVNDGEHWRHLRPSDIAVLVRRRATGQEIQRALIAAGIPAVFTGGEGVFASSAAQAWLVLLSALADPRPSVLLHLASTPLIGWSPRELADADEDQRTELVTGVRALQATMHDHGVAAVYEELSARYRLPPRLLAQPDGERMLTDLRHLAERLNSAERRHHLDLPALTAWLAQRIDQARTSQDDDSVRRLETERRAVSIMTIHKAKGLQFPVVALPDLADRYSGSRYDRGWTTSMLHVDGQLSIDLYTDMSSDREAIKQAEEQAEDLRLVYVAATRAQSRLIAWWANTKFNTSTSPLHRLLNADKDSALPPALNIAGGRHPDQWPLDRQVVDVVSVPRPSGIASVPRSADLVAGLAARKFHDHIDRDWTRTSYSGLTAGLHGESLPPGSVSPRDDEPDLDGILADPGEVDGPVSPSALQPNGLAELPGGTQFGSLVHSVLEITDPASSSLDSDLLEASARMLRRWPVAQVPAQGLATGLASVLRAPLGDLTNGRSLTDLGAVNRLAELEFEMPLGRASRHRAVSDLAGLWADRALVPEDDPLVDYGAALAGSAAADRTLSGFLTGSIDAVLRVAPAGHAGAADSATAQFCLIDYKTNRIPVRPGDHLGPHSYTRRAMTDAMIGAHYPLQALIYSVALHRYLGQRLPGYSPAIHLGGVGYLFVRGMTDDPSAGDRLPGVFLWHPRPALVAAASSVLAGGDPRDSQ
ncbi:UvrD-helicase domain-containing protein [Propionibacterium freudenreichii]|uniref:UvrD-helicase domain-containing protein n=1 Tax=Propionibacterium freudenreichii TaxID=1744 RepID=UPI0021A2FC67|nr:UvrD-helicase domain-containing protein [Propionibacterium freudenreichii]